MSVPCNFFSTSIQEVIQNPTAVITESLHALTRCTFCRDRVKLKCSSVWNERALGHLTFLLFYLAICYAGMKCLWYSEHKAVKDTPTSRGPACNKHTPSLRLQSWVSLCPAVVLLFFVVRNAMRKNQVACKLRFSGQRIKTTKNNFQVTVYERVVQ